MTYNPNSPQPFDIPSDSQDDFLSDFTVLNNFFSVDHFPLGHVILNADLSNPCEIESTQHGLVTGDQITVNNMLSTTTNEYGNYIPWSINGNTYTVTVLDANNFSIPVDTSSFDEYVIDSGNFQISSLNSGLPVPYGYHRKITTNVQFSGGPNRSAPFSALFDKFVNTVFVKDEKTDEIEMVQKIFQNNNSLNDEFPLTGANIVKKSYSEQQGNKTVTLGNAFGFQTAFNLKINIGNVFSYGNAIRTYALPVVYSQTHFTVIAKTQGTPAKESDPFITAKTLNDFSIKSSVEDVTQQNFFISIGR